MMQTVHAKLLLIDDDPNFLDITERRLRVSSNPTFEIASARSWADALPLLSDNPALILLDVRMNSLSGDRLCKIIKERNPAIRVTLYSSEPEANLSKLARESGADGYLSKSATRQQLIEHICKLLP
jgi:two-component system, OmpR family, response regulator